MTTQQIQKPQSPPAQSAAARDVIQAVTAIILRVQRDEHKGKAA